MDLQAWKAVWADPVSTAPRDHVYTGDGRGGDIDRGPFKVALLGIRGFDRAMALASRDLAEVIEEERNAMGVYDDAIVRRIGDELTIWRASTDPGRWYIENPLRSAGCARLREGLWSYRLGPHRGNPALIQAGPVTVDRLDRRGKVVGSDTGDNDDLGIHIHSGGSQYTVGRFSAGCQVVFCPEGAWGKTWHDFFDPIADAMKSANQRALPYLLTSRLPAVALPSIVDAKLLALAS